MYNFKKMAIILNRDDDIMSTKKKKKTTFKFNNLLILLVLISSCFLIYHILLLGPIEPFIRYIIIGVIVIINILFFLFKKKKSKKIAMIMMILFISLNVILCFSIRKVYGIIDSINKNKIIYSSSLIALQNAEIDTIDDVSKKKIGLIDDNLSVDNYIIAKEMIEEEHLENDNEFVLYDDLLVMLHALYDGKIDLMFVSSNYDVMFQNIEGFENINHDVKTILEKDKTIQKESSKASMLNNASNLKPFSILLMGVDSEKDGLKKNAYANGDGLILITFNPQTFNITMMSIPRDSYVPVSCRDNTKNKLTHVGWFGTDCMMETIENVFDVDIHYYVKVNFKGVVEIVDALGGVTVDVPKKLCTDDSNRQGEICIDPGLQTLNGEQALVLARNRYDLRLGDIDRGYNQQLLIKALLNKMTSVRDVSTLLNILESVSNNLDTNLTTEEILSFYNIFKDILASREYQSNDDLMNIVQIKLAGTNKKIYFENLNSRLSCYLLDEESVENASREMKVNLNLEEPEMVKNFQFGPS